jgi:hypothetical protein
VTTHHHPVQFEERDGEIVVNVPNVRIKLIRNTKGYQWEISCADDLMSVVLHNTKAADEWLRKNYGSSE